MYISQFTRQKANIEKLVYILTSMSRNVYKLLCGLQVKAIQYGTGTEETWGKGEPE